MAMPQREVNCVSITAAQVVAEASHVHIVQQGIKTLADILVQKADQLQGDGAGYGTDLHFTDGGPLTVQYLLVVDALNFCFWPDSELQYEHLSKGLKVLIEQDPHALDAERLAVIDGAGIRQWLGWPRVLPQQEERARLIREIGSGLLARFQGQASNLVAAAGKSALRLVELITATFPGFRDHAVYRGRQVFFYKRAQIFVGDVYGTFRGTGLGEFHDIHDITMFADYRVPVVLCKYNALRYSEALAAKIEAKQELASGCEEEVEIRAASIVAVERLREELEGRLGHPVNSVQVDWQLWEAGEMARSQDPPHHRTLTIYY